jgi:SAM-dependent methyltransferase
MIPFVCPATKDQLREEGGSLVSRHGKVYPIREHIPRFVSGPNYAQAFGLEWTVHRRTQLDSVTGSPISRERLERCLGAPLQALAGLNVFEPGCGAGRFTELLVGAGALVHAVDLSVAVEANRKNIGERSNYVVAQADVLSPPFPVDVFDAVIALGMIQHTPSPEKTIASLYAMVKPGGLLVIDHYGWDVSSLTKLAPVFRLLLKDMPPERSKRITDRLVQFFFPLHWAVRKVRPAQMLLSRISPCLVYFRSFPQLSRQQQYEWCRLDTYDHLTDRYKHVRTCGQIRRILSQLGADQIDIRRGGNGVEGRCRKPQAPSVMPFAPRDLTGRDVRGPTEIS